MNKRLKSLAILIVSCSVSLVAAQVGEPGPELWVDGPLDVKPGGDPRYTDADADYRGRQVYVWDDNPTADPDSSLDVFMRVFDSSGNSLVGPVQANTFEERNQLFPRVAIAGDGSFLVVWQSYEPPEPDDNFFRVIIRSQAYDAEGTPVGSEQVLSSLKTLVATDAGAELTALPLGGYVVVWESYNSANPSDTSYTIQGRLVNSNGTPNGGQFQVNSLISGTLETDPSVTALADNGFFATWASPQIHGRRFTANGTPVGDQFQVNTYASLHSRFETSVATNDDGRVLVIWTDAEENLEGGEIRGRLYSPELAPLGSDFRINTLTTGAQGEPEVANYGPGGFFVVWTSAESVGPDNEPTSIEGRIVTGTDSFGSPQFLVNEYTLERQNHPGIGGSGGLIAISWFSASNAETSQNLIMGQFWNVCGIFCDGFE